MADGSAEGIAVRHILPLLLMCAALQAESRVGKWARRSMIVGYCAASAVDGWQSTRPGVRETNPALRDSAGGLNVSRMVTFKAGTCASLILADRLGRGRRRAATVGTGVLLGVQVLTDVHNGKVAR
jgi:hypothetical protein